MHIDARHEPLEKLFLKLKDVLSDNLGNEVSIDILVSTEKDARRVETFVSMSGCTSRVERRDDHFFLHVSGSPCCA